MKALGFDIKLDTNGSFPDKLERLIKAGDLDYIAMDIKSSLSKYSVVTNSNSTTGVISSEVERSSKKISPPPTGMSGSRNDKLIENIKKSIKLIMDSGIDYEFRTTVCHPLHEIQDFQEIGKMIKGAKRYFLQNFVASKQISEHQKFTPFTDDELKTAQKIMADYAKEVRIR